MITWKDYQKYIPICVLLLCMSNAFASASNVKNSSSQTSAASDSSAKLVKTVKLKGKEQISERLYPGRIVANQKVDLGFQVAGQVIEFPIDKGDSVEKGGLLSKLDQRDFVSNVNQAKADYINAKGQFERAEGLLPDGYISKSQYDRLLSEYQMAKARLSVAEKALSDSVLLAPFKGMIANTYIENYENVKAKQVILSLQNITNLDIIIHLPEQDLIYAERENGNYDDSLFYVTLDAVPDRKFKVKLKEIATVADPVTNTYEVTLTMPMSDDLTILPGMSATFVLGVPVGKQHDTLRVPVEAVGVDEQGKRFVLVVDEKTMVLKKQPVTVGHLSNGSIDITSGLEGNERIVVAGVNLLREGTKVRLWTRRAFNPK